MNVMTLTRTFALFLLVVGGLTAGGCATVQPWQRGRLADRRMMFDPDDAEVAYMTHWQEAREASSGGYGVRRRLRLRSSRAFQLSSHPAAGAACGNGPHAAAGAPCTARLPRAINTGT
jgi:hypothetical protein